jgi:peptidoglycan/LPS O-acetylase OafA/YrhL
MGDRDLAHTAKVAHLQNPRTWIRPHYKSFNGLRGVAVLLVFLCHYGGPPGSLISRTLWVGVDLFFVLSGFLITGILYDSLASPRYFRNFYVRRALRIFPIFFGFFLVLAILIPILHLQVARGILAFVFYFGNLTVSFADLERHNPTMIHMMIHGHVQEVGNIGHLWSLCVEEQFYLIWPAVVWWVRDRRRLMTVCTIMIAFTLGLRCYLRFHASPLALHYGLLYFSTYTRCDSLLIGAWLALFLRGNKMSLRQLRRMSAALAVIPAVALGLAIHHWRENISQTSPLITTIGFTLISLIAAGILLRSLDEDSFLARVLRFRPLSGLGAISYGFYFIHAIPSAPLHHFAGVHPALVSMVPFFAFGITVSIAWLSFHYFESPFLRLKSVLAPQRGPNSTGAVKVHISEPRPS